MHTDLAARSADLAADEQAPIGDLLGDLDFDGFPSWPSGCAASVATGAPAAATRSPPPPRTASTTARSRAASSTPSAWSSIDPLAEHAQRRLMRLHYLRGDRASAIAAFERFEQRLKDELGTRPSAETIELLATIEGAVAPRAGASGRPCRRACYGRRG